jgi:REP element-mobilizing transposase RayT
LNPGVERLKGRDWKSSVKAEIAMPSSHLSLHYHLIFSTRDRIAYLHEDWRGRLHTHLGDIINNLGGVAEKIGGMDDHVHLLIGLRATHRLSDVVREIKSLSSKWIHEEMKKPQVTWQDGYGGFTVSASRIEVVKEYIARQEEFHRRKTFQEEYLKFLEESGIKYDEKYLW